VAATSTVVIIITITCALESRAWCSWIAASSVAACAAAESGSTAEEVEELRMLKTDSKRMRASPSEEQSIQLERSQVAASSDKQPL